MGIQILKLCMEGERDKYVQIIKLCVLGGVRWRKTGICVNRDHMRQ